MTVAGTLIALAALPAASTSATSRGICPGYCGQPGGPELIGVRQLGGGRASFSVLLAGGGRYELEFTRVVGGHVVRVRATVINDHPQVTLTGRVPTGGRSETVAVIQLRSQRAGVRSTTVELNGRRRRLVPGTYVVTVNALTRGGALWLRGSSIAASVKAGGRIAYLLEPRLAPDASTEAASAIAQTVATLSGNLDPYGQSSSYYFQYGTTTAYGAQTLSQAAGAGRKPVRVSANVIGLSLATTYHYRLVASACSGCRWGTSYGADHTFTTTAATGLSEQQIDADRAVSAYNAMQASFYAADGSSLYAENSPSSGNPYSYLWPFSRALVGTATLAGVPPNLLGGASYQAAAQDRLTGLSRRTITEKLALYQIDKNDFKKD